MAKPLAERIASARSTDRVTITDLEALIAEATAERDRLSSASEQAAAESVDFRFTDEDRDEAAGKSARYARTATALTGAIGELTDKLTARRESESQKAKAAERAAIIAERDALTERLRERWPAIEREIIELLSAIKASDARIAAARMPLESAEAVARGCAGNFVRNGVPHRRLLDATVPSFAEVNEFAWPAPVKRFDYAEAARMDLVRHKDRMATEAARWSRFMIIPPVENRQGVRIATRRGEGLVSRPGEHWMCAEQVEAAKALGCTVEPLKPGETVGRVPEQISY